MKTLNFRGKYNYIIAEFTRKDLESYGIYQKNS